MSEKKLKIERVQTGVRMEKRMLKVLKAVAEYHEISLGNLLEGIVLYSFEGRSPFLPESLKKIEGLKEIYDMDYDTSAAHNFIEEQTNHGK